MIFATIVLILIALALTCLRLLAGPTLHDRVLAANSIGTKIVLLIALIAFLFDAPENILDIAILYALITFASTIAVLKFFRRRPRDVSGSQPDA